MSLPQTPPTIKAEVSLGHSKLMLRSDDIVEMICDDEMIFDVPSLMEVAKETGKLTGGAKKKLIVIAGKYTSVTKEAREYMATPAAVEFNLAEAYVIQSLAQRILANFYIKFNKPLVPTKVFTDRAKAEKWIKSVQV